MNKAKRRALEAAGFVFEDAEDFLELTAEERRLVELRLAVSRAVRARREQQHLTQEQVARKLKSSQSRVAKMEAGAADVSLFFAVLRSSSQFAVRSSQFAVQILPGAQ